jgi:hypothetical protein
MKLEKPVKRMTLRELMTHAEKCSRDLIEHVQSNVLPYAADFRDLNRPVRRRSHYPAVIAVQNSLQKLEESNDETQSLCTHLLEQLHAIRDSARREVASRI